MTPLWLSTVIFSVNISISLPLSAAPYWSGYVTATEWHKAKRRRLHMAWRSMDAEGIACDEYGYEKSSEKLQGKEVISLAQPQQP
ncbi:hypothetical protein EYF80_053201 [Liparis tanakae]|uniref:Uncharacterized protein n=1 Tax=Liparis tanakae TaxID=230148 RepID=A0A4Z2F8L5_9TELE|nr:hypothetical protein EYF80_053201 [Liparis tanakae]